MIKPSVPPLYGPFSATFGAQTVLSELESIGRSNLTWPASPATELGRTVLFEYAKNKERRISCASAKIDKFICFTLSAILTPCSRQHAFAYHLVIKHSPTIIILPHNFCITLDRLISKGFNAQNNLNCLDRSSFVCWLVPRGSTDDQLMIFFCFRFLVVLFGRPGIPICHAAHCIC